MIDPQARPGSYIKLLALVVLGLDSRLFTVLICSIGGLLVGLLVKLFGDHNAIFAELMQEFGKTGRFNYHYAPGIVITAFVSLIAGASLDPKRRWRTPAAASARGCPTGSSPQPAGVGRGHGGLRLAEWDFLRDVVSVPSPFAPRRGVARQGTLLRLSCQSPGTCTHNTP